MKVRQGLPILCRRSFLLLLLSFVLFGCASLLSARAVHLLLGQKEWPDKNEGS